MTLRVLGSGSSGNGYILENRNTALAIECGISFKDFKVAMDFRISKVAGLLLTHEHLDHSKHVADYTKAGISVYTSPGTISALAISSHRLKPVEALKTYTIGEFKVVPFNVKHDCKQPYGFLIKHADCGTVVFITDSCYVANKFPAANQYIIEANFSRAILNERLQQNQVHAFVRDRVLQSHMSLETCMELLRVNDLRAVNNIVLVHLSDANSDAELFKKEVRNLTGKKVHIAENGLLVDFSKTPF